MDQIAGIGTIWEILKAWGPFGIVLVIWWYDSRAMRELIAVYREDTESLRRMYENNAILVKNYEKLAGDLQDVVIMNTQATTRLGQAIETNQFCPVKRNP